MKFQKNMGTLDRALQFIVAGIIIILYATGSIDGWVAIVFGFFAIATSFTGLTGFCPLYPIFGWNTRKVKEKK